MTESELLDEARRLIEQAEGVDEEEDERGFRTTREVAEASNISKEKVLEIWRKLDGIGRLDCDKVRRRKVGTGEIIRVTGYRIKDEPE